MTSDDSPSRTDSSADSGTDSSRPADGASAELHDFIRDLVREDVAAGKHGGLVATRFPPEPNGYLHIGHAKSIVLNFGVAREHGGTCNLRFDDTNPTTEDMEYVEAIQRDVEWLGYRWDALFFASDYFEEMYGYAERLIRKGLAYVDSSSEEEIQELRGTVTEPGRPGPYRDRSVEENLDLFHRMRAGEFPDGAHVLRAKIDLGAANMKMRDPILYRIRHAHHYRAGDAWCLYPMYDFAHALEDAIEGITHSLCTLEFENNREIYDWVVEHCEPPSTPRQIEFARLALTYTVMSKRLLIRLVEGGHVEGWDDPRLSTLAAFRRRGVPPEAIRAFCEEIGVAKSNSVNDLAQLDHAIRDDLNHRAPRVMGVLRPLAVTITNYPEGESESLEIPSWPRDVPKEGSRPVPFGRRLWIERDDFAEDPPQGFKRLAPGREVRLRHAYFVTCDEVVRDDDGEVVELRCSYDPETRGGSAPDGRKPSGTLHWVSAEHAVDATVRLYDRLFRSEHPSAETFLEDLNPDSLEVVEAKVEPSVLEAGPGSRFQFERQGYFYRDPVDGAAADDNAGEADDGDPRPVFNRIVPLRDSWAKQAPDAVPEPPSRAVVQKEARKEAQSEARDEADQAPAAEPKLSAEEEARLRHHVDELGLAETEARILATQPDLAELLADGLGHGADVQSLANWIVHEVRREANERGAEVVGDLGIDGATVAELVALVDDRTLSPTLAKDVFAEVLETGRRPAEIVETQGLRTISDSSELGPLVDRVLGEHPAEVARYREGKRQLLGFFVGRVMAASHGTADPQTVQKLLRDRLG